MSTSPLQSPTFNASATASALFGAGGARSEASDDSFARMLRDFDANSAQPVPVAPDKAPAAPKQEASSKPAAEGEQPEDGATSDIQRDNARLEARRHSAAPAKARPNTEAEPAADTTAAADETATALATPGADAELAVDGEEPRAGKAAKARKPQAEEPAAQPAASPVAAAAAEPEAVQGTATRAAPAAEAEAGAEQAAAPARGGPAHRSAVLDASRQAARAEAAQQSGDAAQVTAQSSGSFAAALAQQSSPAAAAARSESAPASFNPAAPLAALTGAPAELSARPAAATAPASPIALAQPLHAPAFANEMAARLSLAAADGVQEAQLHLNPSEMGPVAVQIVVDGQQAQISFHAEQADTRQVLEQSLPELAAALREQGLTLSGGGVFQQQQQQTQQQDAGAAQAGSARSSTSARIDGPAERTPTAMRTPRGVVDVYA